MPSDLLLLDTHSWIWAQLGLLQNLSRAALQSIKSAEREGNLRISVISVWEVANLDAKKRVLLSLDCHEWVREALRGPVIELVDLSPEIAIDSTRLPEGFHADPADRILIATARNRNAILVTADRAILEYSRSKHVRVLDARAREGL